MPQEPHGGRLGDTPGMRVQSVRFSEDQWHRIQVESRRQGVSASQYIREAAIARYWLDVAEFERPELGMVREFLDAAQAVERG